MSTRGRCRCGAILRFADGPAGYKTRCPGCGAVVRLSAVRRRRKRRRRRAGDTVGPSASPTLPPPFSGPPPEAPTVELVPYAPVAVPAPSAAPTLLSVWRHPALWGATLAALALVGLVLVWCARR